MLLFRVDANSDIGIGHVMRCISIADAALEEGERSVFLTASTGFEGVITQHGHECQILGTNYTDMLPELRQIRRLIEVYSPDALIVDSYYVTWNYLVHLQQFCHEVGSKLIYLDDVLAFAYPCDILVNYNIYGPEKEKDYNRLYSTRKTNLPTLLLGPKYVPLRSEFRNIPKKKLRERVRNILVSTGGSDPEHMNLKIIETIKEYEKKNQALDVCFQVVIGAMNKDKKKIEEASKGVSRIVLHHNISDMSTLMQSCDIAISATGSTIYELCATQTPSSTYILADNQILGAKSFERHGILKNCGDVRDSSPKELSEKLLKETIKLAKNYREREQIAIRMGKIVDGYGAKRIVDAVKVAIN